MLNPKYFRALMSASVISVLCIQIAFAEDDKVETVVVSATRSEGPQMPVATQIKIISSDDIRISGAANVAEVLRGQAGIQIQDTDGSGSRSVSIAMRGFSANAGTNTLVLVDGRKLNNPSLAGPALNTIALKDVERIEIVQGSAGVLYGDQAVGGVINIITRTAKPGELHATVSAEAGTGNLENYTANVYQAFENGLNYALSAQKRNDDNYRDNNQSESTNVLGKIGYSFSAGKIYIEKQSVKDDLGLAGALFDNEAAVNPRATKTPNNFSNQESKLTRVGGEYQLIENWKFLAEYADRIEDSVSFYGFGLPTAGRLHVKNATPRIVGNIATENGNAVVTFGYDTSQSTDKVVDWGTDIKQVVDAYYGQVIYPATQKLSLTTGIRHSSVDDNNYASQRSHSDGLNATELGANYQIDSEWRLFTRYADGFRFATAQENDYIPVGIEFLKVQTSASFEAGFAWENNMSSVKYSLYSMNIKNEIFYNPNLENSQQFNGANVNLPDSNRTGFMIDSAAEISEIVSLHTNYTYTHAVAANGEFDGKQIPFVAKHMANVGVVFNLFAHVTAALDAGYTGSRYRVGDDANQYARVAPITLFNANLLWLQDNVEVGLRVKNITNETYADYYGINWAGKFYQYPQPGREYSVHMSYRF